MARAVKPRGKSKAYIREWMELAKLKQSDLVAKLDYSKAKANALWHGEQRTNEDILEEIAALVNARPYELLQHPDEAHRARRLEAALLGAVAEVKASAPAEAPATKAPGRKAG